MNMLMPSQHPVSLQGSMGGFKMPPLILNTEDVIIAWEQIGGDIYSDHQQTCCPSSNDACSPGTSDLDWAAPRNDDSARLKISRDAAAGLAASLPPFIPALSSFLAPAQSMDPFNWAGCNSKFPLHAPFMLPMASSQPTPRLSDFPFPKLEPMFCAPGADHHDNGALESKPACSGSSLSSGSDVALVPDATSPTSTGALPSSPMGMMSQATAKLLPVMAQSLNSSKGTGEVEVRSRKECLERYKEKKARRLYTKKIRYQLRKINADRRPRIKGRFVKKEELEEYLKQQAVGVGVQVSDELDESDYEEDEEEDDEETV